MPRYPQAREGEIIRHKQVPLNFTLFFSGEMQGRIMASDIWGLLNLEAQNKFKGKKNRGKKEECLSYLKQAEELFKAFSSTDPRTSPLLLYYSFMNFVKFYILMKDDQVELTPSYHGVEIHPDCRLERKFYTTKEKLRIQNKRKNSISILDEFYHKQCGENFNGGEEFCVRDLLYRIPSIHRTVCHSLKRREIFYVIDDGMFVKDSDKREVWADIFIPKSSFSEGREKERLKERVYFKNIFHEVETDKKHGHCYCFETNPYSYSGGSIAKTISDITKDMAKAGIMIIITKYGNSYYVINDSWNIRLTQPIIAYLVTFYLGSIVRYRPYMLEDIFSKEKYGWIIKEFLRTQPNQFYYILASEILGREILIPWAMV